MAPFLLTSCCGLILTLRKFRLGCFAKKHHDADMEPDAADEDPDVDPQGGHASQVSCAPWRRVATETSKELVGYLAKKYSSPRMKLLMEYALILRDIAASYDAKDEPAMNVARSAAGLWLIGSVSVRAKKIRADAASFADILNERATTFQIATTLANSNLVKDLAVWAFAKRAFGPRIKMCLTYALLIADYNEECDDEAKEVMAKDLADSNLCDILIGSVEEKIRTIKMDAELLFSLSWSDPRRFESNIQTVLLSQYAKNSVALEFAWKLLGSNLPIFTRFVSNLQLLASGNVDSIIDDIKNSEYFEIVLAWTEAEKTELASYS